MSKTLIKFLQQSSLRQRSGNSGFTLLEQMIIVAVIGVLAVISVPNFSALLNRIKLDQSVAEVRSALEETQRQAMRGNKSCDLILNLSEDEITGSCLVTGKRTLPAQVSIATNLLPDGPSTSEVAQTPEPSINPDSSNNNVATDIGPSFGISPGTSATKIALAPETRDDNDESNAAVVIHIISSHHSGDSSDSNSYWDEFACSWLGKLFGLCPDNTEGESDEIPPIPVKFGTLGTPQFEIATAITPPNTPVDPSGKIVVYLPQSPKVQKKCISISNTLGLARVGTYVGDLYPPEITDSGVCTASNVETQ